MLRLLTTTLLLSAASVSAHAQTVFVDNAKVITNTEQGQIASADIIVQDGKIAQIGTDLTAPEGATVINAEGQWVTPGLFLPFAQIGLVDISAEAPTNDIGANDAKTSVSNLASDSFNPQTTAVAATRIEGITHMAVSPNAGHDIFGGIGLIANTSGDFDSVEKEKALYFIQLGERGAGLAGGSRSASLGQLRAALDDARNYTSRFDGPEDGDALSRKDAAALRDVFSGQIPLLIAADRAADILKIIALKDDYTALDIIILGASESWVVADALKTAGVKVMVDPHENLPASFEAVGARADTAALLAAAGVDFAIMNKSQDTGHNGRLLPQHAGNAVGYGLDWDCAFRAITSTPARWFNIDTGTLAPGSDTLVVWDGDPLEVTVSPTFVMINGEPQSLDSRQTALRDRYNPTRTETMPHKYR